MNALEALREARGLIASPDKWTQRVSARREDGVRVDQASDEACRWCLIGAMGRIAILEKVENEEWQKMCRAVARYVPGYQTLEQFNDDLLTTHEQVLRAMDGGISLLERSV